MAGQNRRPRASSRPTQVRHTSTALSPTYFPVLPGPATVRAGLKPDRDFELIFADAWMVHGPRDVPPDGLGRQRSQQAAQGLSRRTAAEFYLGRVGEPRGPMARSVTLAVDDAFGGMSAAPRRPFGIPNHRPFSKTSIFG